MAARKKNWRFGGHGRMVTTMAPENLGAVSVGGVGGLGVGER